MAAEYKPYEAPKDYLKSGAKKVVNTIGPKAIKKRSDAFKQASTQYLPFGHADQRFGKTPSSYQFDAGRFPEHLPMIDEGFNYSEGRAFTPSELGQHALDKATKRPPMNYSDNDYQFDASRFPDNRAPALDDRPINLPNLIQKPIQAIDMQHAVENPVPLYKDSFKNGAPRTEGNVYDQAYFDKYGDALSRTSKANQFNTKNIVDSMKKANAIRQETIDSLGLGDGPKFATMPKRKKGIWVKSSKLDREQRAASDANKLLFDKQKASLDYQTAQNEATAKAKQDNITNHFKQRKADLDNKKFDRDVANDVIGYENQATKDLFERNKHASDEMNTSFRNIMTKIQNMTNSDKRPKDFTEYAGKVYSLMAGIKKANPDLPYGAIESMVYEQLGQ